MTTSVENSNAGPAQKQSSGSTTDTVEERANPAPDSQEMSSEHDPSQAYSSQGAEPERSGGINDRDRLQQILWQQYIQDDKTNNDFEELRNTTNKLIQRVSRTNTLGSALSQATQFGLKRSIEAMFREIQTVAAGDLRGIVNWHDKSLTNWTPLHVACAWGRLDLIKLLLDHEADREARDGDLQTPLHVACYYGEPEIVELLIRQNANILAQDAKDQTPLIVAIQERETSCMNRLLKIESLLQTGSQQKQRYSPISQEKSAMQWAIEKKFTQGVVEMFEDPSDFPNDEDVRKAANEVLEYALRTEDDLNDQVEKVVKFLMQEKLPLLKHSEDPEDPDKPDALLSWAVKRHGRHSIAKQLLQRENRGPADISAIEMAARQRRPQILWSLIAASPRNSETINQVGTALRYFRSKIGNLNEVRDTTNSTDNKRQNEKKASPKDHVIHILRNPPMGVLYGVHGKTDLKVSNPEKDEIKSMRQFDDAIVAEFYGGRDVPVQSAHNVYDVVYSQGPVALLDKAKTLSGTYAPREKPTSAKFTWIHLPATNIKWMEDLSLRLMTGKEQNISNEEATDVDSFLRTTWFQVPDQSSKTRIMRPQFKERSEPSDPNATKTRDTGIQVPAESPRPPELLVAEATKAEKIDGADTTLSDAAEHDHSSSIASSADVGKQKDTAFVASSAVYMPFLSFSTLTGEVDVNGSDSIEHWPILSETAEQRMDKIKKRYQHLIERYDKNQTVHGCATLDEAYYHFSSKQEDDAVQEDCAARNRSQVVTKQFLRRRSKPSQASNTPGNIKTYWPVLRVNQIWIWTIANKWLISATSHQPDDYEQSWIDGFSQHLNRRLATGGTQPQPASTSDMLRVMIDYCIGFYERRRECEDLGQKTDTQEDDVARKEDEVTRKEDEVARKEDDVARKLSMRQIFSNHINYVARTETKLFEEFRQEVGGKSDITKRVEMAKEAISKAESLLSEIKDVRDELNILSSIVNYQNTVQRQVHKEHSSDSSLSSRYISNDIANMEKLATRIQSAVDSTLSLSGSHIANLQAEEAARQGKSLMMFTISTIVFLPLSFLTSFFALDIESFQIVPGWVFVVIFGTSLIFTVLLIVLALYWNLTWTLTKAFLDGYFASKGDAHDTEQITERVKIGGLTTRKNAPNELDRNNAQFGTGAETVTVHPKSEGQGRTTQRRSNEVHDLEKGRVFH